MNTLPAIGRFLYALPMAAFGLFHFLNAEALAGIVPVPGGRFWVYLTGAAFLAAAAAILTGRQAVLASRLLGLMLLIFVLSIHLPGVLGAPDPGSMQLSMTMLLKDTALAGGAWILSGVFALGEGAGGGAEARGRPAREEASTA